MCFNVVVIFKCMDVFMLNYNTNLMNYEYVLRIVIIRNFDWKIMGKNWFVLEKLYIFYN